MKRVWLNLILLCGLLVAIGGLGNISLAGEGDPPDIESMTKTGGMPGRPLPERPIPHHEAGHLSKAADYSAAVTRMSAASLHETVELKGLEGMLADDTISDPFEGNYTFVSADQIMFARNDDGEVKVGSRNAFQAPDSLTKPNYISGSAVNFGDDLESDTTPSIASGDLNGDGQAEQIVAWIGDDGAIRLSVGELPGSQGVVKSDPAVDASEFWGYSQRTDVFVRGYDDALWHRHYDGEDWEDWNNDAGGYLLSSPTVAAYPRGSDTTYEGYFKVYVVGVYSDTRAIYGRLWNGNTWASDWNLVDVHPAGGVELADDPAAIIRQQSPYQLDLFSRASDNTLLWLTYENGEWGEWQSLGGIITSAPVVVSPEPGHLQVFARGVDDALWYIAYDGSAWSTWRRMGGLELASKPAAAVVYEGLVGHWKLDDGSGTTAGDASGNGYDGTLISGPAWVTDTAPTNFSNPYALQFDGSDDYVKVGIDVSESGYALSLWFKTTCDDCGIFSVTDADGDSNDRHLYLDGGNLCARVWSDETICTSGTDYADGAWHHAAHTFGDVVGEQQLYVDGTQQASGSQAASDFDWQTHLRIGYSMDANNGYMNGLIDDVRVYNWALASADIAVLATGNQPTLEQSQEVHIYARGADDALWQNRFDTAGSIWSGWENLGGALGSGVGVAVRNDQIDLFAQTMPTATLQQKYYDGSAWTEWQDSGGLDPCCTEYDTGVSADVVAVETGYFTGDGREQIVVAYADGFAIGVKLYDIEDGFHPRLLSDWTHIMMATNKLYLTTGDLDDEPERDEIYLFAVHSPGGTALYHYVLDVYPNSQDDWAIGMKVAGYLLPPSDTDWMDTAVTSGDLNGDGKDELAYGWVACADIDGWNVNCVFQLAAGEVVVSGEDWTVEEIDAWDIQFGQYNLFPSIDLAAADLDSDAVDEIVYIGPAPGAEWYARLQCYTLDQLDVLTTTLVLTTTWESYDIANDHQPMRLATGDFNRDAKAEVAVVYEQYLHIYGRDEDAFHELVDPVAPGFLGERDFSITTGPLTGESLRVGPPTYRRQTGVESIVAIINAPPYHIDTLDGVTTTIAADSFSAYEMVSGQTDNVTTQPVFRTLLACKCCTGPRVTPKYYLSDLPGPEIPHFGCQNGLSSFSGP